MTQYKVAICRFPGGGHEHPDVSDWLADTKYKMRRDPRISAVGNWRKSDTPITMLRNCAVKESLAQGADYILMIDNDMGPDYLMGIPGVEPFWDAAWEFMMLRREREDALSGMPAAADDKQPGTIAAPYCGPPPEECPFIFRWKTTQSDHPDPDFKLAMIEREDAAIQTGVEQVAALPTGLILYDSRVFKVLDPPWFEYEYEDPPFNTAKASTEDVFQTRNASLLGMPQFVAWNCWAIHHKSKAVKKPQILTIDAVRDQLREHLMHGHKTGERINHVHPDYVAAQHRLAVAREGKEADARAKARAVDSGPPAGFAKLSASDERAWLEHLSEGRRNSEPQVDRAGGAGTSEPSGVVNELPAVGRSIDVSCEEAIALVADGA